MKFYKRQNVKLAVAVSMAVLLSNSQFVQARSQAAAVVAIDRGDDNIFNAVARKGTVNAAGGVGGSGAAAAGEAGGAAGVGQAALGASAAKAASARAKRSVAEVDDADVSADLRASIDAAGLVKTTVVMTPTPLAAMALVPTLAPAPTGKVIKKVSNNATAGATSSARAGLKRRFVLKKVVKSNAGAANRKSALIKTVNPVEIVAQQSTGIATNAKEEQTLITNASKMRAATALKALAANAEFPTPSKPTVANCIGNGAKTNLMHQISSTVESLMKGKSKAVLALWVINPANMRPAATVTTQAVHAKIASAPTTTAAPTTVAPTTVAPTTVAPTTIPPTTKTSAKATTKVTVASLATSEPHTSTLAPTTTAPATVASTTKATEVIVVSEATSKPQVASATLTPKVVAIKKTVKTTTKSATKATKAPPTIVAKPKTSAPTPSKASSKTKNENSSSTAKPDSKATTKAARYKKTFEIINYKYTTTEIPGKENMVLVEDKDGNESLQLPEEGMPILPPPPTQFPGQQVNWVYRRKSDEDKANEEIQNMKKLRENSSTPKDQTSRAADIEPASSTDATLSTTVPPTTSTTVPPTTSTTANPVKTDDDKKETTNDSFVAIPIDSETVEGMSKFSIQLGDEEVVEEEESD